MTAGELAANKKLAAEVQSMQSVIDAKTAERKDLASKDFKVDCGRAYPTHWNSSR